MPTPAPKPEIERCDPFRKFVATLPCCLCRKVGPNHPHHVRHKRGYGEARNVVPLCAEHHDMGHLIGWRTFQLRFGVKLQPLADILWTIWEANRDVIEERYR